MTEARCKICRTPERRRLIDAALDLGQSAEAIARREGLTGFPIDPNTIIRHRKLHYAPGIPEGVAKQKKDVAIMVAERTTEWLERENEDGKVPGPELGDLWQKATGPGLQAQKILDTRDARTDDKKLLLSFARMLSGLAAGAQLAPTDRRLEAVNPIEGEYTEVK